MTPRTDDAARASAIAERRRNVIVDASAGTGKTSVIVERLLALVAPRDGEPAIAIDRLAAITFTRKAAGELRVRTRQRMLEELATAAAGSDRAAQLHAALAGLDTAQLGTIHAFADHLLRAWPAQARLDPRYELADDDRPLHAECAQRLVHAAETRTLGTLLHGTALTDRADEATATLLDLERAGLLRVSRETEHWTYHGLDHLVADLVRHRDVDIVEPPPLALDRAAFDHHVAEYLGWIDGISAASRGGQWLIETGAILGAMRAEPDPVVVFRELADRLARGPSPQPTRKHDFLDDDRAWNGWRAFAGDDRKQPVRARALRDDLGQPLHRWLAIRLARLRPVVLHVYELVKARHHAVDHVDLLLRLRDLLRDDPGIRAACQQRFDHLFVDEFQDTDPLQAEIVLFLAEATPVAATWDAVTPAPGKLTIVGDPKQSIYRFRRADIATYQRVVEILERAPHHAVRLSSSFRTAPGLVDWLNTRCAELLGSGASGERFRHATGEVFHQPLAHGRTTGTGPAVHAVPIELPDGALAADYRALEAAAMARYLRWLVQRETPIIDPATGQPRPIHYGDLAVLALTTTTLPVLFDALDRDGVPYAARGGTLFLDDPLHRQLVLALCALADRDDGVALAALLRPPFFALELADLARSRPDDPADRAVQARAIVRELRRQRFVRSPGATARALLEDTGLGRTVALGANGTQRLRGLRELCLQIEARALAGQLDFDATMERVRGWIDRPEPLDRPLPVTGDTVRIMTIHQAKGLEFPAVVLWDSRAAWAERTSFDAWTTDRAGRGWQIRQPPLLWEEPAGLALAAHERTMREAERKRLVYVAATRARDLLVIPVAPRPERSVWGRLLGPTDAPAVVTRACHRPHLHADWFDAAAPTPRPSPPTCQLDVELGATWDDRAREAARPRLAPRAFTRPRAPQLRWQLPERHGTAFGHTVHVAIGLALTTGAPVETAVAEAARRHALDAHQRDAVDDVSRALATLHALGITARTARLEYPIAGRDADGQLVAGYVDLVAEQAGGLIVLDFKTDLPPAPGAPLAADHLEQVRGYTAVLGHALGGPPIRAGLLFTADGAIRWIP